jgi:ATP phosphoribosyltransferase regulatory subunit
MPAESVVQFSALEAQAQRVMGVFAAAGFEAVAPAIIQPAGVFLDTIGEALRARTYVFNDPDGTELCLRPDLTVPVCRLHLERDGAGTMPGRYCYNGAAFRYQPSGATAAHPREFRQAGIETLGLQVGRSEAECDAETVALMLAAIQTTGLDCRGLGVKVGDLGVVRAVFDAFDMPNRWRDRLQALFWRPQAFRAELKRLTLDPGSRARAIAPDLLAGLKQADQAGAEARVAAYVDAQGHDVFGARTLQEITQSLQALALDAGARPLDGRIAEMIERIVAVSVPLPQAPRAIAALARNAGVSMAGPLEAFEARTRALAATDLDVATVQFSGEFGRTLEYYSGFVFEIALAGLPLASPVAGGGRYDGLMRACGARGDVPAVGAAIHTERLLAAVGGSRA